MNFVVNSGGLRETIIKPRALQKTILKGTISSKHQKPSERIAKRPSAMFRIWSDEVFFDIFFRMFFSMAY
jgi:hypothetical protein